MSIEHGFHTIYIRNLNERVRRDRMIRSLYEVFCHFGTILQIECRKTRKMKGQAFIVFANVRDAVKALTHMQGIEFHNKLMQIEYARQKSDIIAQIDGSYKEHLKNRKQKRALQVVQKFDGDSATPTTQIAAPDNRLFVENLPADYSEENLISIFKSFDGFVEVRHVPQKNIAFIYFNSIPEAATALTYARTSLKDLGEKTTFNYAKK